MLKCATEFARLHKVSTQSCTQNRPSPIVQSHSADWILSFSPLGLSLWNLAHLFIIFMATKRCLRLINFCQGLSYGLLKGHLRALPTEIISSAKWRSNRKWLPTIGPADRLATKFPKISSFDEFCTGLQLLLSRATSVFELQSPAQKTSFVLLFFIFSEVGGWLPAKVDQYLVYGGLWYFAERGKLLPWTTRWIMEAEEDDAQISSPSSLIWISCAVRASDRTN